LNLIRDQVSGSRGQEIFTDEIVLRSELFFKSTSEWSSNQAARSRGLFHVDDVISRAELEEISKKYKVADGFDIQTVNARASLSERAA
jgi:hypothetical protein